MTDTVIKGTGNSRSLRTVPNALTLYDTHEKMLAAMIDGSFPIDLGHLNAAGLEQRGTDLVKATLLSDTTETALWGGAEDRTVDEALGKLGQLVAAAQETADAVKSKAQVLYGSYVGSMSGSSVIGNKTITLLPGWKIFMIMGRSVSSAANPTLGFYIRGSSYMICPYHSQDTSTPFFSVSEYSDGVGVSNKVFNFSGATYSYAAIG